MYATAFDSGSNDDVQGFGEAAPAAREQTRPINVGGILLGGGAPVVVQSMLTTRTSDVDACLAQIAELAAAGCELVRVAIPTNAELEAFGLICASSSLPVIADIHFDFRLALGALRQGAAKLRVNPGNIGDWDMVDAIIDAAGVVGVPIRIGVNAGSLAPEFAERRDLTLVEKLVASATAFVSHFEDRGFTNVVLSAKAHDVRATVETCRLLSRELPSIPLHLGVTEAGTLQQGTVKSAAALGALLLDGIGDTIRVSLTADPVEEVRVAWELLAACGLRRRAPELVSCPTCGRCQVDLIRIANEVQQRLRYLEKPLTVAVMGCVVNGPGEAKDADVGVACGAGKAAIFSEGRILYSVDESQIIDALFEEIDRL
jgi:(E)-4-hydroxy-3-methylbut-2-enyl-diphosphate synthase